ncbi:MAG: hypothetical protein WCG34_08885 [Leptolinea sp.]
MKTKGMFYIIDIEDRLIGAVAARLLDKAERFAGLQFEKMQFQVFAQAEYF